MTPQFACVARWLGGQGVSLVVSAPRDPAGLSAFPEETRLAESMQVHRRSEFLTGRSAAREALVLSGGPACAIPQGTRGEPLWPAGFTGSITHTKGLVAAGCLRADGQSIAAGESRRAETVPQKRVLAVGIDLERTGRVLSEAAWQHVLSEDDVRMHAAVTDPGLRLVLFSAKESLYKAVYPLCGEFFGFDDASLVWTGPGGMSSVPAECPANGVARLVLRRTLGSGAQGTLVLHAGQEFVCHWECDGDWLLTAVVAEGNRALVPGQ